MDFQKAPPSLRTTGTSLSASASCYLALAALAVGLGRRLSLVDMVATRFQDQSTGLVSKGHSLAFRTSLP